MSKLLSLNNLILLQGFLRSNKGVRLIRWITYSLITFLVVGLLLWFLKPYYVIGVNETDSLPGTFYLIEKNVKPKRGEYIVFRIPPGAKYYPNGYVFTKIAIGVEGDLVEFKGREVYVNGQYRGTAKTHSKMGEPLELGPSGIIPPGNYFAWTPHKDSYDSRYADIGWVTPDRLEGRAIVLF